MEDKGKEGGKKKGQRREQDRKKDVCPQQRMRKNVLILKSPVSHVYLKAAEMNYPGG